MAKLDRCELVDAGSGRPLAEAPGQHRLDRLADVVDVLDAQSVDAAHLCAAIGEDLNQALALQDLERLANRLNADPAGLRHALQPQPWAR